MSGEVRVLHDTGGVLSDLVDGLHDVVTQFEGLQYALVGGVAVLVHVPGHRVTEDIDSAVRGFKADIRKRLEVVADAEMTRLNRQATVVLASGVPVDVLEVRPTAPRPGLGALREAKAYSAGWAIETAVEWTVDVMPAGKRGSIVLPVASPAALVVMKTVSTADPGRGPKRATDLHDAWRLLSDNPAVTADLLVQLQSAPEHLLAWTRERLREWFAVAPDQFVRDVAPGLGSPRDASELEELWYGLLEPGLA